MTQIFTPHAPAAIGPYTQAISHGGMVYTAGQIPLDPHSGHIEATGIEAQTQRVMDNLAAVLEAAGSSWALVVKTTCFLADMNDFPAFNAVYERYATGKPARSTIAVKELPKGALVEVECIAAQRPE